MNLVHHVMQLGDLFAAARLSGVPRPPRDVIGQAVAVEGVCCCIQGALGTGSGSTAYAGVRAPPMPDLHAECPPGLLCAPRNGQMSTQPPCQHAFCVASTTSLHSAPPFEASRASVHQVLESHTSTAVLLLRPVLRHLPSWSGWGVGKPRVEGQGTALASKSWGQVQHECR